MKAVPVEKIEELVRRWRWAAGLKSHMPESKAQQNGWNQCADELEAAVAVDVPVEAQDGFEFVREEIEECAKIVDELNRSGPYDAIGAARLIRSRKSIYAKMIQSVEPQGKPDARPVTDEKKRETLTKSDAQRCADSGHPIIKSTCMCGMKVWPSTGKPTPSVGGK